MTGTSIEGLGLGHAPLASDRPGGVVAGMCGIRFIQLHRGEWNKCLDVASLSEPHQMTRSILDIEEKQTC